MAYTIPYKFMILCLCFSFLVSAKTTPKFVGSVHSQHFLPVTRQRGVPLASFRVCSVAIKISCNKRRF